MKPRYIKMSQCVPVSYFCEWFSVVKLTLKTYVSYKMYNTINP